MFTVYFRLLWLARGRQRSKVETCRREGGANFFFFFVLGAGRQAGRENSVNSRRSSVIRRESTVGSSRQSQVVSCLLPLFLFHYTITQSYNQKRTTRALCVCLCVLIFVLCLVYFLKQPSNNLSYYYGWPDGGQSTGPFPALRLLCLFQGTVALVYKVVLNPSCLTKSIAAD